MPLFFFLESWILNLDVDVDIEESEYYNTIGELVKKIWYEDFLSIWLEKL